LAKAKRVFQIAKDLGVVSKAIVEKCQAEGVPGITNHMSTVKVGLEVTINEWFANAGASNATAVETAAKVDLTKARKGVRRRAMNTELPANPATVDATTVVAEPPPPVAEPPSIESPPLIETPPAKDVGPPPPEPQEPPGTEPPTVVEDDASSWKPAGPVGRPNVPDRPTEIRPVGKQLAKPKEVELKGPKIVRIERPDVIRPKPPLPRAPAPESRPAAGTVPGITRSQGPARGKGAGEDADQQQGGSKAGKRRSLTTRRGRSADAQLTGPSKFSEQDLLELDARLRGAPGYLKQRRRDMRKRESTGTAAGPSPAIVGGTVEIAEPITIKQLSAVTGIKSSDIVKYLFAKGIMATINSAIDTEAAMEAAMEYNIELVVQEKQTAEQQVIEEFEKREQLDIRLRPPVVTVLGHVDHGKTSLLDQIRQSDVAAHEDGGITQHVGAYRITLKGTDGRDRTVVFLDTPGHEAFTSMRARGATLTDFIVLVVAADDGVMPQTIESINHAKAAEVPLIVALNKIDLPQATEENTRKIYGQLAEQGLNPVEWGGSTEIVKTSAATGVGVTDLMEMLDFQADLLELSADFDGPARGTVIEAEMQEGRGPVARVLVQQGQISVGDFIVIGRAFGRVRDMTDDRGGAIRQAGPSTPIELSGIDMVPDAGDKFYVTGELRKAEEVALHYRETERHLQLATKTKVTLDNFAATLEAGKVRELRVVLKADVQGSVDVLNKSLSELGNDEVTVRVIHAAVGGINESDVLLADASDAIIIGFHVVGSQHVRELAEQRSVDIRLYRVIYDVTDAIFKALEGMLEPERKEQTIGSAELREVFKVSKVGNIAGCLVMDGLARRDAKVRVIRDDVVVTDNRAIETLHRVKDEASEVRAGTECGIRIAGFDDLKPGDTLVFYSVETVARSLQ